MPRPTGSVSTPSYRKHRASGQAIVTIGGHDRYLGPWKSKASHVEYDRLIGEWLASGRRSPVAADELTVTELIARYWTFAKGYYANANTGQIDNLRSAVKIVRRLYGDRRAVDFGPLALRAVQTAMVEAGWARTHINAQIGRVKRMVKWAVAHELLPSSAHHAMQTVDGLRFGKSAAREDDPVKPVPTPFVEGVLPFLSAQVKAMVQLQALTGMRSGELVQMRTADIDTTDEVWAYRPEKHKNRYRGHDRVIYLGERGKEMIRPFLKPDLAAFLFSPAEAEASRRAARNARRKTPVECGNAPGTNRTDKPLKRPGSRYDTHSYRRAIQDVCEKAFPIPSDLCAGLEEDGTRAKKREWRRQHRFHPHQLRHNHATQVRRQFGIEAVQAALGQKSVTAAQIYGEKDAELAQRIAAQIG